MSAGWVAGSVKARLLLERRAGPGTARRLARSGSLREALAGLSGTLYAPAASAAGLEAGQRALAECTALELRVIAGWLPHGAAAGLRALAGWFEIANVEDRLAYLAGGPLREPFELGVLSSAWDAAAGVQSGEELRAVLAGSAWGDPGGADPQAVRLGLRFAWARRVSTLVPEARVWAAGAAAILLAEELQLAARAADEELARRARLGPAWRGAETVTELRARLPSRAAWALAGIDAPEELWRAELAWWQIVGADAERMVRSATGSRQVIVATVALLGLDAVRTAAALAAAAHGGAAPAVEVVDALC